MLQRSLAKLLPQNLPSNGTGVALRRSAHVFVHVLSSLDQIKKENKRNAVILLHVICSRLRRAASSPLNRTVCSLLNWCTYEVILPHRDGGRLEYALVKLLFCRAGAGGRLGDAFPLSPASLLIVVPMALISSGVFSNRPDFTLIPWM